MPESPTPTPVLPCQWKLVSPGDAECPAPAVTHWKCGRQGGKNLCAHHAKAVPPVGTFVTIPPRAA